jgi:hypothetical protein
MSRPDFRPEGGKPKDKADSLLLLYYSGDKKSWQGSGINENFRAETVFATAERPVKTGKIRNFFWRG